MARCRPERSYRALAECMKLLVPSVPPSSALSFSDDGGVASPPSAWGARCGAQQSVGAERLDLTPKAVRTDEAMAQVTDPCPISAPAERARPAKDASTACWA